MTKALGLLDTSVVVDLANIDLKKLPLEATISAVSLAELSVGPITATSSSVRAHRQIQVQLAESQFSVLPFDARVARAYATLFERMHSTGTKARGGRALDLMIAATALAHELPLYTRNPKDFAAMKNLVEIVSV